MNTSGDLPIRSSDIAPAIQFVPASLLRVRYFLFEHGMAIVPWAPAEQVLEEFYELLTQRKDDPEFWAGIGTLLESLQNDLKDRLAGNAQDNEILPLLVRQDLLTELQTELSSANKEGGGFLGAVRRVSPQCSAVLLLLGVAVTVGCGARTELDWVEKLDGGGLSDVGGASGMGGMAGTGGTHFVGTGGSQAYGTGGSTNCAFTDVKNAIASCGLVNTSLVACTQALNASWRDGLNALLACKTCDEVTYHLNCLQMRCASLPANYLESLLSNCYTTVYMGVRMET